MKSSHGTDFSRMMRSMQTPRQVGRFAVRSPLTSFAGREADDLIALPRRLSREMLVHRHSRTASFFSRNYTSTTAGGGDSHEHSPESARATRTQAHVNEIKMQLIKLVDEEIKGSQQELDFCNAFLAKTGFKLVVESDNRIALSKTMGKLSVKVWFNTEESETEEQEEEEQETEGEEEIQEISSDTRMPEVGLDVVVQITLVDKSNKELTKLTLSCSAEREKLYIVTMHSADGNSVLEFDELSDKLQWKIYEYLESMAVNDELAQFAIQYANHSHDHKNVAVLRDLKLTLLS